MASKDVTSVFGSIRFVLPLILIFFIAAGSANACPKYRSSAAYRTNSYSRNVSYMAPVVISYGGRCADTQYGTRRVNYVSMRDNGYYEGGTRYVAVRRSVPRTRYVSVRDDDYYVPTRKVRYVVRDDDYGYTPRYVAVRRAPVFVAPATRHVAVRSYAPRARVAAHYDEGYASPTYVAVQQIPVVDDFFEPGTTRVVAVRNTGCGCSRAVSYRGDLDDVEIPRATRVVYRDEVPYTSSVRHEVVKSDFIDGTEEVIYSSPSHDNTAYVDLPDESVRVAGQVSYSDMDDVNFDRHPVAYDDVDFSRDDARYNNVAYISEDDMEAACLPELAVYDSQDVVTTRRVRYVPADELNDNDVIGGTNVAYVSDDDDAAPPIRYSRTVAEPAYDDSDAAYMADGDIDADCPDDVSFRTYDNAVRTRSISYVPAERVSYARVENVVLVPANDTDTDCSCETSMNTSYVEPMDDVDAVSASDVYYSDRGDQIMTADAYDDSIAAVDVDYDANYDSYFDDHNAEFRSDVGFVYTE